MIASHHSSLAWRLIRKPTTRDQPAVDNNASCLRTPPPLRPGNHLVDFVRCHSSTSFNSVRALRATAYSSSIFRIASV